MEIVRGINRRRKKNLKERKIGRVRRESKRVRELFWEEAQLYIARQL